MAGFVPFALVSCSRQWRIAIQNKAAPVPRRREAIAVLRNVVKRQPCRKSQTDPSPNPPTVFPPTLLLAYIQRRRGEKKETTHKNCILAAKVKQHNNQNNNFEAPVS